MKQIRVAFAVLPVAAALLLSSCAGAVSDAYVISDDPGKVEMTAGSDLGRVTLTEQAANRLAIQTTQVTTSGTQLVVPSDAIFVDSVGAWWVYTNPEPYVFVRHAIEIEDEVDERVFLSSGPAAGTAVVTVGVAELSGVESEVGH